MNKKARKNYFRNKLEENHGKPKAFWDTLPQVLPSKNNHTEIDKLVVNSKEPIDKRDIVNSLNEYFTIASSLLASQQFHDNPVDLQQESPLMFPSHSFKFRVVSKNDIFKAL